VTQPNRSSPSIVITSLLLAALLAGCRHDDHEHDHEHADEHAPTDPNVIAVPAAVRQNLGITFVPVERRRVAATLRLPGAFELLPNGRREVRPPFAGRVEVRVQPLQTVQAGQVLATIDAPEWRGLQRELGELEAHIVATDANVAAMQPLLAACERHRLSLQRALDTVQQQVVRLEQTQQELGGQAQALAEARVLAAQSEAQVAEAAEKHTQTHTRITELEIQLRAAQQRRLLLLAGMATHAGRSVDQLLVVTDGIPAWQRLAALELQATAAGVVERLHVSSGAWLAASDLVLTVVDPAQVRVRAQALQSDLARLADGMPAWIEPIGALDPRQHVRAELRLGAVGDPLQRTLELFAMPRPATAAEPWPAFVRGGVAVMLAIETAASGERELAIPSACVLPDGLQRVFFLRDPNDKDKVRRIEADLGVDDGRFVVVKSGLADSDEVVLAGAYELVLASSSAPMRGGHFHADGTFHADDHK
jgi:multidrug resistance efflux pump